MEITNGSDAGRGKRVILNVGGKKFETLIDTLRKYPETMLGAMFSCGFAVSDDHGEYFFDRDPHIFPVILNFYRHGKILIPSNLNPELVKEELDFFGINIDDNAEKLGEELKKDADSIAQKKLLTFVEEYLMPKMKSVAHSGHYSYELGLVPEKHSMNNMTNLPSLQKNTDFYELFSEKENRRRLTKMLKKLHIGSQWDRSEQVNITTKEFLFECFKLTVWWHEDIVAKMETQSSSSSSSSISQKNSGGGVANN